MLNSTARLCTTIRRCPAKRKRRHLRNGAFIKENLTKTEQPEDSTAPVGEQEFRYRVLQLLENLNKNLPTADQV